MQIFNFCTMYMVGIKKRDLYWKYLTEKGAPQYIHSYCRCWPKPWNLWILSVNMFCQNQWFRYHERWRFLYIFGDIGMPQDDNYLVTVCIVFTNKNMCIGHFLSNSHSNSTQTSTFEEKYYFKQRLIAIDTVLFCYWVLYLRQADLIICTK